MSAIGNGVPLPLGRAIARAVREAVGTEETMNSDADQVYHVLQFFGYAHLPERLQASSKPFHDLAHQIAGGPQNAETVVALRKLLKAKDAAVRARLVEDAERVLQGGTYVWRVGR